jgi:hypothetical protein
MATNAASAAASLGKEFAMIAGSAFLKAIWHFRGYKHGVAPIALPISMTSISGTNTASVITSEGKLGLGQWWSGLCFNNLIFPDSDNTTGTYVIGLS